LEYSRGTIRWFAVLIDDGQIIDCGDRTDEACNESEYQGLEHLRNSGIKRFEFGEFS
jgi:hypothetical protein